MGAGVRDNLENLLTRMKVLMWLTHQEEECRFIVLEADPIVGKSAKSTHWTKICVGQADCVLLIASAGTCLYALDILLFEMFICITYN